MGEARTDDELVAQLPVADWTDQDLLTREGAGDLLVEEMSVERDRIAALADAVEGSPEYVRRLELERRLAAMESIRNSLG